MCGTPKLSRRMVTFAARSLLAARGTATGRALKMTSKRMSEEAYKRGDETNLDFIILLETYRVSPEPGNEIGLLRLPPTPPLVHTEAPVGAAKCAVLRCRALLEFPKEGVSRYGFFP